jgi:hypothetical protein
LRKYILHKIVVERKMSSIQPHISDKDEISREDLLRAMEKLSHIIEFDKKIDGNIPESHDYYESPEKHNSLRNRSFHSPNEQSNSKEIDYLREVHFESLLV